MIDNLDGLGTQDYTTFVDSGKNPSLVRKLNTPAELKFGLVAGTGSLVVPALGSRVTLDFEQWQRSCSPVTLSRLRHISTWAGQIVVWFTATR